MGMLLSRPSLAAEVVEPDGDSEEKPRRRRRQAPKPAATPAAPLPVVHKVEQSEGSEPDSED